MCLPRRPGDVGRFDPPVAGRFRSRTKRTPDEAGAEGRTRDVVRVAGGLAGTRLGQPGGVRRAARGTGDAGHARSEARRLGTEGVITSSSRTCPYTLNNKQQPEYL